MMLLAAVVLFVPGVAIAVLVDPDERDPVCFLAAAGVYGAAVAVMVPWFAGPSPGLVRLATWTAAAAGLSLAAGWRRAARALASLDWRRPERAALAAIALVGAVRLAPYGLAIVAPGGDMSMHTYTARLILEADGLPAGYRPLLPVDTFGASATGLPTLGALLSALSGAPAHRGTFFAACLVMVLVSLVVYAFIRSRAGAAASAVAMLVVTLAARDPQAHFEWGGNPTLLSLALGIYGLFLIERLNGPGWRRVILPAALVLSAAVVAHSVIPFALLFVLPLVLIVRLRASDRAARPRLVLGFVAVAVAAVAMLAPYLARFHAALSPAEVEWIRHWQRLPVHVPPGPLWAYPVTLVWYIGARLGPLFALWVAAALLVWHRTRRVAIGDDLLFGAFVLMLVVNAVVWVLPASYALYPDRIVLLLTPVGGRIIGVAADAWPGWRSRRARLAGAVALGASLVAGVAIWFAPGMWSVAVTDGDVAAIKWIDTHAPADAIIENNYGDAGIWIPALAFRAVCSPHVNIIYIDELENWRRDARPAFLYLGARRVMPEGSPFERAALVARPDRYTEVFRSGEAMVFRILPNPDGSLRPCAPSDSVTVKIR
jgi:hypothetical protein